MQEVSGCFVWVTVTLALYLKVMNERQLQMDYKMEANRRDQEESLERREELIRDLDLANQLTRREEKRKEEEKMQRKRELEGQVSALHAWPFGMHARPILDYNPKRRSG